MNKVLNRYEDFGKIIETLSSRNMEDDSYYVQYVLSPYMQALGYDVFDIDETERMFNGDKYKVKGVETEYGDDISFIFCYGIYCRDLKYHNNFISYILLYNIIYNKTIYY